MRHKYVLYVHATGLYISHRFLRDSCVANNTSRKLMLHFACVISRIETRREREKEGKKRENLREQLELYYNV